MPLTQRLAPRGDLYGGRYALVDHAAFMGLFSLFAYGGPWPARSGAALVQPLELLGRQEWAVALVLVALAAIGCAYQSPRVVCVGFQLMVVACALWATQPAASIVLQGADVTRSGLITTLVYAAVASNMARWQVRFRGDIREPIPKRLRKGTR